MTTQLNLSFWAGEILRPGQSLNVQLPQTVNENAVRKAVTLQGLNNSTLAASLSVASNTIKVSTDSLLPGDYQLQISELRNANNEVVVSYQVTPFSIREFPASIASDLRIFHTTSVSVGDHVIQPLGLGEKPALNSKLVQFIKAENRQSGLPIKLAFDESGNAIDGKAVLAGVARRRFEKYGKLDPKLFEHVSKLKLLDPVEVVIWPLINVDVSGYVKPTDGKIKQASDEASRLLKKALDARDLVVNTIKTLGAKVETVEDYPFVYASLGVQQLQVLSRFDTIGKVFLNDKSAQLDLSNSMAIARAPEAHNLGVRGAQIRVAVFEDGPSNVTHLDFAGRFRDNPSDIVHARITSGIIRNIQPNAPHGYAPDCLLYSANSYDNAALRWAVGNGQSCTVISQSFHREDEQTSDGLSSDDLLKDWLALRAPYPTIVQAAGNIDRRVEYVNHKGYNTISVGNHDDNASSMSFDSVFKNPYSQHGDRELPEIAANGDGVTAVGEQPLSGTSFAAPAVAGTVALMQSADTTLRNWPEGCRAILFASAFRNVSGDAWPQDLRAKRDGADGVGALSALRAVQIAKRHRGDPLSYETIGWEVGTLRPGSFDSSGKYGDRFRLLVGMDEKNDFATRVQVALAWDSKLGADENNVYSSSLTLDLDLQIFDMNGNVVAHSASFDNSYEFVQFYGTPNSKYDIVIRNFSGSTENNWFGIAWHAAF